MNIWLSENFFLNKKVKRLYNDQGAEAVICLQKLWLYASRYAIDNLLDENKVGILKDFDEVDIELSSEWSGEGGLLFSALKRLKLITQKDHQYYIHDFADNNPHLYELIKKKVNGSVYAKRRWDNKKSKEKMGDPIDTQSVTEYKGNVIKGNVIKGTTTNTLSSCKKDNGDIELEIDEWMEYWIKESGQKKMSLKTQAFRKQIKARIKELTSEQSLKEKDDRFNAWRYIVKNKKAQALDPQYERFTKHDWNLTTLTRPSHFSTYLVEPEHKNPQEYKSKIFLTDKEREDFDNECPF